MNNVVKGPGVEVQPPMKVAGDGYQPGNTSVYPSNVPTETYIQYGSIERVDPLNRG
jgi:hypothetical protein